MAGSRIPVVVIAGFLGSGKTTLLNHLLRAGRGTRIGVVVNDFGSINVDAMAVAGQVDSMVSLGNGCLCCVTDTEGLDTVLAQLSRPSAGIDVVVIEASGLAEPPAMIRMLLASENRRIEYGGLVEVVDGAEFERTRECHPELARHLRIADLVVLNKTDRLAPEERDRLVATVRELSGGRPVLPTTHGRVDPALLFDRRTRPEREPVARQLSLEDLLEEDHDRHAHTAYTSVEFTSDRPLHPRRFMDFLHGRPAELYRMKGFVHFGVRGHRQKFVLHTVGNYARFQRTRWAEGEPRRTQLVLIGTDLRAEELRGALADCVAEDPARVEPLDMLPVLRYTRSR